MNMDKDTGTFIKGEYKDDTDSQQVILKGDGTKLLSLIIHIHPRLCADDRNKTRGCIGVCGVCIKTRKV